MKYRFARPGEVFSDTAVAVAVDAPENFCSDAKFSSDGDLRIVEITGADSKRYVFAANFGDAPVKFLNVELAPQSSILTEAK